MSSEPGGPDWVQGDDGDWYPPGQAPQTERSSTIEVPDREGQRRGCMTWWAVLVMGGLALIGLVLLFLWFVDENSAEEPLIEDEAAQVVWEDWQRG